VITPERGARGLVARDRRLAYVAASFRPDAGETDAARRLMDGLGDDPRMRLGAAAIASAQVNEQTAEDLRRAEPLVFPLLFALSFVFFRGVVAALLALIVGAMAILLTTLGLRLASELGSDTGSSTRGASIPARLLATSCALPIYVVRVTVTPGALTDERKADVIQRVTRVLAEVDNDPDRPYREPDAWVHLVEVPDGNWGRSGA
jgi:phenylpyruvate tautomerase PptA (4-oxalocrotonate tautomerase family)